MIAGLDQLRGAHYGAILADPPWSFATWSDAGKGRAAERHYDCLTTEALFDLDVGRLAKRDAALFLWVTDPFLPIGLGLMRAWGFEYRTVAFTWAKRARCGDGWTMGNGYWTRANPEMCLLGIRGTPRRRRKDVCQLIVAEVREHSRKPDVVRERIERLVPGPYVELFARARCQGWDAWGDQVDRFEAV